jgi:hypothetical protein
MEIIGFHCLLNYRGYRRSHGTPISLGLGSVSLQACCKNLSIMSSFASEFNSSANHLREMGCSPRRIVSASPSIIPWYIAVAHKSKFLPCNSWSEDKWHIFSEQDADFVSNRGLFSCKFQTPFPVIISRRCPDQTKTFCDFSFRFAQSHSLDAAFINPGSASFGHRCQAEPPMVWDLRLQS